MGIAPLSGAVLDNGMSRFPNGAAVLVPAPVTVSRTRMVRGVCGAIEDVSAIAPL